MASCFKCTSAEKALTILDKYIEEVDSMLIDGKIAEDNGSMLLIKSKQKKPLMKILILASSNNKSNTQILDYGALMIL